MRSNILFKCCIREDMENRPIKVMFINDRLRGGCCKDAIDLMQNSTEGVDCRGRDCSFEEVWDGPGFEEISVDPKQGVPIKLTCPDQISCQCIEKLEFQLLLGEIR